MDIPSSTRVAWIFGRRFRGVEAAPLTEMMQAEVAT